MNEQTQNALKMSPEKLMSGFTRSRFSLWMAAAVVVHVIFIGSLSFGYIRDTWIDPDGAAERKAAAEELARAAAPKPAPAPAPKPVPAAPTNPPTEQTLMEQRKNTPVIKAITQTAATNEIPKQPDDLGISINDTHVK